MNASFSLQHLVNICDEDIHVHVLPPQTKYFQIKYVKKVSVTGDLFSLDVHCWTWLSVWWVCLGRYVVCCPCGPAPGLWGLLTSAPLPSRSTALSLACLSGSPLHFLQMSGDTIMIASVFTVRSAP